jgi:hypothetical protein
MDFPDPHTLSQKDVQALADRLYSRAVSSLVIDNREIRSDLISASRALRRLLVAYERAAGHELHTIMICGGV